MYGGGGPPGVGGIGRTVAPGGGGGGGVGVAVGGGAAVSVGGGGGGGAGAAAGALDAAGCGAAGVAGSAYVAIAAVVSIAPIATAHGESLRVKWNRLLSNLPLSVREHLTRNVRGRQEEVQLNYPARHSSSV
jgi:hypothetical protein